ncbi:MAG: hypothetical protein ABI844_17345 [Saprospiraceae bacterium]
MPFTCQGGPPCTSGGGVRSATVTFAQLTRTIISNDFADVFILDSSGKLIATYSRSFIQGTNPLTYKYNLKPEQLIRLIDFVDSTIQILTTLYDQNFNPFPAQPAYNYVLELT